MKDWKVNKSTHKRVLDENKQLKEDIRALLMGPDQRTVLVKQKMVQLLQKTRTNTLLMKEQLIYLEKELEEAKGFLEKAETRNRGGCNDMFIEDHTIKISHLESVIEFIKENTLNRTHQENDGAV